MKPSPAMSLDVEAASGAVERVCAVSSVSGR
jgi:hypothetical protein